MRLCCRKTLCRRHPMILMALVSALVVITLVIIILFPAVTQGRTRITDVLKSGAVESGVSSQYSRASVFAEIVSSYFSLDTCIKSTCVRWMSRYPGWWWDADLLTMTLEILKPTIMTRRIAVFLPKTLIFMSMGKLIARSLQRRCSLTIC